jgi:Mg2+-importing ATPase
LEYLARFGPNDPAPQDGHPLLVEVGLLFANPLVLILLVAAGASAFVGERVDAFIIVAIVLVSAAIDFLQTYRSHRTAELLRAQVAPTATVLRDGAFCEIPRVEVVPGDVVRLSAGDLVPADAVLIEARDLHVQEASLTGESMPVEKHAAPADQRGAPPDPETMAYLGTSVMSGTAVAEVVATGKATSFGSIAARLSTRAPQTAFDRGIRHFGLLIMQVVLFLVLFVVVVSVALRRPTLESLLFAVALAVGLTPEFLPMITSATLAKGAVRMAREKVVVKHLSAIQNLGGIDVLCSDKTGTLTAGEMALDRSLDAAGSPAPRVLSLAALNSRFETGIKSPLDAAILARAGEDDEGWSKDDEIPFDFERRCLSIAVVRAGQRLLVTKGAPEAILARCASYEVNGAPEPLTDEARARCLNTYRALSADGLRTLAVAWRHLPERGPCTTADERDLSLAGFLSFSDPPLADAALALQDLARDGVAVKILTGDGDLVTRHVCAEVGLPVDRVVLGEEIDRMTDAALAHVAERSAVFARLSPAQKSRIILALQRRSHVVGYIGDGINDAPSLHAADVGISVSTAVDVARDAADIILLERGLRVLHSGIIEGRKAFGNVMKYLLMGTSSNFGNVLSMAAATVLLPFLPMLPTQILLNNLLYDLAQITIPTDNVDEAYIRRPQRWDIRTIRRFMLWIGPLSSVYDLVTFFVLLHFFKATEATFHTGWFVESLATQTLVLFVIRTTGNPLQSRPSAPLAATTLGVAALGALLPFTPLAAPLGFTPLPLAFYGLLAGLTATYLLVVEAVKRRVLPRVGIHHVSRAHARRERHGSLRGPIHHPHEAGSRPG